MLEPETSKSEFSSLDSETNLNGRDYNLRLLGEHLPGGQHSDLSPRDPLVVQVDHLQVQFQSINQFINQSIINLYHLSLRGTKNIEESLDSF